MRYLAQLLILSLTTAYLVSPTGSALDWPSDRALPRFPDIAESIDVADLTGLKGEEQALLTSLQGLVNRQQPRLYLYWNEENGADTKWLEGIRRYVKITDWSATPFRLLVKYGPSIKGAIVYDVNVPDTINLATTLAGYRGAVIASAELAKARRIPVLQNLQGMFRNKKEVYSYGLKNIYPKLTKRMLAAIAPLAGKSNVNGVLRDYIVATAAPCIWLDPKNPDELSLLRQIMKTFDANAVYLGWFPHGYEMEGVTEVARQSLYVLASDFFYNGSLLSGMKKFFPLASKPRHSPYSGSSQSNTSVPVRRIENKVYVSFTWSEGDNIQYCQRHMRTLWNHPDRGKVPFGWTITPLLTDIAPNILSYFQTTATENDALVVGPSGAGYTNPVGWPSSDLKLFLDQTKRYTAETRMESSIWVYNRIDGNAVPPSNELISAYKRAMGPELLGIGIDAPNATNPYSVNVTESLVVAGLLQMEHVEGSLAKLKDISKTQFNGTGPVFVVCSLVAWNFTPGDILGLVKRLGKEFEVVRPDEQFQMIRSMRQDRA